MKITTSEAEKENFTVPIKGEVEFSIIYDHKINLRSRIRLFFKKSIKQKITMTLEASPGTIVKNVVVASQETIYQ